jgi:putative SOS response-associated peptidase YedK
MVARFTLTSLDGVAGIFGAPLPEASAPRFNIAPLQSALIQTGPSLALARWGLLPPWRGHGGKRDPHILVAAADAIDGVPLLRNAFTSQRCLVIADGFYVWRRTGKRPQPFWIHPAPDLARPEQRTRTVAFAGIAATHRDDGRLSFAIILGPSSPLVASLLAAPGAPAGAGTDAAVPVVVPREGFAAWLTGARGTARALLGPLPAGWRAEPVSPRVNSVDHDDAACIESSVNPAQGELF